MNRATPHWFFDNRVALLELRRGSFVEIFTIVAALVLAAFALVTAVFGSSLEEDNNGFYRLVMVILTVGSVWGAFCLSYPERHMHDLEGYSKNAWLAVLFVILSKAVLDYVFDDQKIQFNDILEVLGLCALIGAVGTKAKEITTPGDQPDLHAANIWLAIIGYICLLALVVMGTFKHRRTVALSVNAVRQGQMPAPTTPAAKPNLKKNL